MLTLAATGSHEETQLEKIIDYAGKGGAKEQLWNYSPLGCEIIQFLMERKGNGTDAGAKLPRSESLSDTYWPS